MHVVHTRPLGQDRSDATEEMGHFLYSQGLEAYPPAVLGSLLE